MLVFAVVMGVFFLVLFNYVFGGAIGAGAEVDYLQFLVPGVFVITALQGAQQTSMGLRCRSGRRSYRPISITTDEPDRRHCRTDAR